jgi:alpha-beta hydrolase superfamily lysophospholipase
MWENNVFDQKLLSAYLKEKYNLPLIIMGHSYGSFLTQRQAEINPLPDAFILSGSNFMKGLLFSAGAVISKMQCKSKGERAAGHLMSDMSFKSYEKRFPGTNNWLSQNEENVKKYNGDEACGYVASNNFYYTFMKGIKKLYLKEEGEKINLDKPFYLFSGKDDPVGDYGKGVTKLYNWYKKIGVKRVEMKLYEGLRHETLNEKSIKVYEDTLSFIQSVLVKG